MPRSPAAATLLLLAAMATVLCTLLKAPTAAHAFSIASRPAAAASAAVAVRGGGWTRRMGTIGMVASPDGIIQEAIKKPVVVFSKSYCPYCKKAKEVLSREGAKFDVMELDERKDGDAIQAALFKMTGRRTVPNVFVAGKPIGGGDDTAALSASGKLKPLLQEAGAL